MLDAIRRRLARDDGPFLPPSGRWPQPIWRVVAVSAITTVGFYVALAVGWLPSGLSRQTGAQALPVAVQRCADTRMRAALAALAEARSEAGISIDRATDPSGTGLIGVEWSPISTTLGNLRAKRTSVHPKWAAVFAELLWKAGVREGDLVAAGVSGSFPGLNLALIVGTECLGAHPVVVASLGASSWGANIPEWTWADMEAALVRRGVIQFRSVAYSLGGESDTGGGMMPEGPELIAEAVQRNGGVLLRASSLRESVEKRMRIYAEASTRLGRPIRAYVNIGGSDASLGRCVDVLDMPPGLLDPASIPLCGGAKRSDPPGPEDGVVQYMARLGVPVIHALNIVSLAAKTGVPVDAAFPGLPGW